RRGGRGRRADSRAGPLAPAVALLQDLRALELLTRVSIDRVAGAAHGVPGGELELAQPEVRVVLLVDRARVGVRLAFGDLVPLAAGPAQHLLDLCGRHRAAVPVVLGAAGVIRVAGVTRVTGVAGAARIAAVLVVLWSRGRF